MNKVKITIPKVKIGGLFSSTPKKILLSAKTTKTLFIIIVFNNTVCGLINKIILPIKATIKAANSIRLDLFLRLPDFTSSTTNRAMIPAETKDPNRYTLFATPAHSPRSALNAKRYTQINVTK